MSLCGLRIANDAAKATVHIRSIQVNNGNPMERFSDKLRKFLREIFRTGN